MTDVPMISRRAAIRLLGTAFALTAGFPAKAGDEPSDRGIGGTGITRASEREKIGFVGTIRRFGSIYVNGDRISYPDNVGIVIDGRRASRRSLKIGQVVRVVAEQVGNSLVTRRIDVASEVVGPISQIAETYIVVLGQTVLHANSGRLTYRVGDRIAVSGIRRVSGSIVASLVQPADSRLDSVAGPVRLQGKDAMLGDIRLREADKVYVGRRVLLSGRSFRNGFHLERIVEDVLPGIDQATRFSVEAYVQDAASGLVNGSGWWLGNPMPGGSPFGPEGRMILGGGPPPPGMVPGGVRSEPNGPFPNMGGSPTPHDLAFPGGPPTQNPHPHGN